MALTLTDDTETTITAEQVIATLTDALSTGATVSLTYAHPRLGISARVVRPRRILNHGPDAIVRCFDLIRKDYRTFRIDRILGLNALG